VNVGPLRILQVVSSSKSSGAERHVLLLSEMLRRRGHRVAVACPPGGWLTDALEEAGIEAHAVDMRKRGSPAAAPRLVRLASRRRFDIIHTHLTRATYHGALASFLRRVPMVATVHVYSRDLVYRFLARTGRRLIAVSHSVRNALVAAGVPEQAVGVVYNGTDFLEYQPNTGERGVREEFGLVGDCRLIGLVGRVAKEKGHLVALGAARRIAATHRASHFLFIGRMEPHFEAEFTEAVERNGVRGRVTLTGDRNDVPRLMDAMEMVVLPSAKETFGVVAIEAMARGKPVIATRTGGLEEVIRHGETGLLIDQDEAALGEAIDALLSDPERAKRMGEEGRRWVQDHFSHNAMVDDIEAIYMCALGAEG
jgi:glycosyltransferase involved in cell wall biosynthesis